MTSEQDTWIETTSYEVGGRTVWVVCRGNQIAKTGEVFDDPSGVRAFDHALLWARDHIGYAAYTWKHHHIRAISRLED
jgi:hypothetical protein